MAIGVVIEFDTGTLDQYDQLIDKMGFSHRGKGAPGGLFHWVAKSGDGLLVTDVWESREVFERFADEQIAPYAQDVGIDASPRIIIHEIHNYLVGPDLV